VLPDIALRKKDQGLARGFSSWYVLRNDPSMLRDDRKLIDKIADIATEKISDFHQIADPGGTALKTEQLRGDALEAVVKDFTALDLHTFDGLRVSSIGHLHLMVPNDITKLDLSANKALLDLRGIEKFTSLEVLDVATNEIGDISPISALTRLQKLDLFDNDIVDISPLKSCSNLEKLELSGNRIADLSPLKGLLKLKSVGIEGNMRFENGVLMEEGSNPIQIATGLESIPGIRNPFFLADKLSIRLGISSEGPDAQFTGFAVRVFRSNRFMMHVTRGDDSATGEILFLRVDRAADAFPLPHVPPDFLVLTPRGKDNKPLLTLVDPGNPARTVMAQFFPDQPTVDVSVA
jgi:hypothetical protein